MGWVARHRWWLLGAVLIVVGAVLAAIVWWPEPVEEPRARVYREFDICILTPDRGLADPQAAAVWAGAQEVSLAQSVPVLYVPVMGEQSPQRAAEFLALELRRHAEIVRASGARVD